MKMVFGRINYLWLALSILISLVVSACAAPATTPTQPSANTPKPTPAATPIPSPTTTPTLKPQYGGALKLLGDVMIQNIGYPAVVNPQLNPFQVCPSIENIIEVDNEGNPIPWLVSGWKYDPIALTFTMSLNKGIKFHDGTDFNAAALKWSLDEILKSQPAELASTKSIDFVDDYTVRINMTNPDMAIVSYMNVKPGLAYSPTSVKTNGQDWSIAHPVGTGPFKFVSMQRDVNIKFEKFNDYWQKGKPYLDTIEWNFIADPVTRKASFLAGEGQLVISMPVADLKDLKNKGYTILKSPRQTFGLFMDSVNADSPFYKLEVRQAVSYAINSQELCTSLGYGLLKPTNQIVSQGHPMYNPNIVGYPYNPQKAKDLIVKAGYPNGFTTTIYMESGEFDAIYQAIQANLKAVGIDAKLEVVSNTKAKQISINGWNNGMLLQIPPYVAIGYPVVKTLQYRFSKEAPYGKSLIRPEDVCDLIKKAVTEPTQEQYLNDCKEANRLLIDKYAIFAPIFAWDNAGAKVSGLHDDRMFDPWYEHWRPADAWLEKK
jgi:peptide/nickel transport system substrate-binding protein